MSGLDVGGQGLVIGAALEAQRIHAPHQCLSFRYQKERK